jgi:phosphoglycolate phosphatase
VHGSELYGERTDKRELIAHVLRADGVPAEQATMIGDRSHDIIGARGNGVRSRGVLWGYGSREELTAAGPGGLYETIAELLAELTSASTMSA